MPMDPSATEAARGADVQAEPASSQAEPALVKPHIILDHPPSSFTYDLGCRCTDCKMANRKIVRYWVVHCRDHRSQPMQLLGQAMKLRDCWELPYQDETLRCRREHTIKPIYRKEIKEGEYWWSWNPNMFTKEKHEGIVFGYLGRVGVNTRAGERYVDMREKWDE